VPAALESAAKTFLRGGTWFWFRSQSRRDQQNMGAWYQLGSLQLHLSVEVTFANEKERSATYAIKLPTLPPQTFIFANAGVRLLPNGRP